MNTYCGASRSCEWCVLASGESGRRDAITAKEEPRAGGGGAGAGAGDVTRSSDMLDSTGVMSVLLC